MTRKALELIWQGGEHPFQLGISEVRALQDKCDAGPAFIKTRLETGTWVVDDVVQPIRLGLIGAGMDAQTAGALVKKFVEPPEPLQPSVIIALAILHTVLYTPEGDPVGESNRRQTNGAGTDLLNRSREVKFVSVTSTALQ